MVEAGDCKRVPKYDPIHERKFIASFVLKKKQDGLLMRVAKRIRRDEFLDWLVDAPFLDSRFVREYAGDRLPEVEELYAELVKRGAPEDCYVISADPKSDQQVMSLQSAVELTRGGLGKILSCIPGELAVVSTEYGDLFVCQRKY